MMIIFDTYITTPFIEDNLFFDKKLEDKFCGNDYKEIIDIYPKNWISKSTVGCDVSKRTLNLKESLNLYEKEKEKHSVYSKDDAGIILHRKRKLTPSTVIKESLIRSENDRKASRIKWDGKIDDNINIITFFNKNNYQKLKE